MGQLSEKYGGKFRDTLPLMPARAMSPEIRMQSATESQTGFTSKENKKFENVSILMKGGQKKSAIGPQAIFDISPPHEN